MRNFMFVLGIILTLNFSTANAQIEEPVHQTEDYALFVTIRIKPGKVVAYKSALLPYLEKAKAEPGIWTYRFHQSAEDSTLFELYAYFASKEAHESHLSQPHTKDYLTLAKPLFEDGYPIRRKVFELKN